MQSVIESSINTIDQKRRAVYTALFPYFDTKSLLNVMWYWEDNFSSGNGGSVRQFVAEITSELQSNKYSKKIYNTLMATFLMPVDNLENDPIDMMLAYRSGKLSVDENHQAPITRRTPENTVFNFIMENLLLIITKENNFMASNAKDYFSKNIFNIGMDIHKTKEILQWINNKEVFIGMKYSVDEFSKLIHIFYIGVCEFYGPQKADFFLHTAVEMAEHLPEARQFPPKNFL